MKRAACRVSRAFSGVSQWWGDELMQTPVEPPPKSPTWIDTSDGTVALPLPLLAPPPLSLAALLGATAFDATAFDAAAFDAAASASPSPRKASSYGIACSSTRLLTALLTADSPRVRTSSEARTARARGAERKSSGPFAK